MASTLVRRFPSRIQSASTSSKFRPAIRKATQEHLSLPADVSWHTVVAKRLTSCCKAPPSPIAALCSGIDPSRGSREYGERFLGHIKGTCQHRDICRRRTRSFLQEISCSTTKLFAIFEFALDHRMSWTTHHRQYSSSLNFDCFNNHLSFRVHIVRGAL